MKKMVMVMAVVLTMIMSMLVVTGCNSKDEKINTVKTFHGQLDDGMCKGYILYVRYGVYGPTAYKYCVDMREYRKSLGELVTDIEYEYDTYGEGVWFFYAANIAE